MTQNDVVSAERLRKERGPEWCAIYDTLREFTLSNMVFEGTEDAFCLVDAVSNSGGDISSGEEQLVILADEISLALSRRSTDGEAFSTIQELTAQRDDLERIRTLMAKDWFDFCTAVGVTPDTQEAVAYELKARLAPTDPTEPVAAPSGPVVTVKALDWGNDDENNWSAPSMLGAYNVYRDDESYSPISAYIAESWQGFILQCPTIEAAKAAAQADYASRILSSIEVSL